MRTRASVKLALVSVVAVAATVIFAGSAVAAPSESGDRATAAADATDKKKRKGKRPPVKAVSIGAFGRVLTTRDGRALYYFTPEKMRKGTISCVGGCAVVWPVVTLKKGQKYRKRIKGIPGKFGVIRRPDGTRQLTHRGLPLYSYFNEGPGQVLCDNVGGWFVIRTPKPRTTTAKLSAPGWTSAPEGPPLRELSLALS